MVLSSRGDMEFLLTWGPTPSTIGPARVAHAYTYIWNCDDACNQDNTCKQNRPSRHFQVIFHNAS